jgi:hypothetical protein
MGLLVFLSLCLCTTPSYSWHDQTHLAIAKAAGYKYWFNATGADMTNISRQLGLKLRAEDRNMTKEEAYIQLRHSASLLKAVIIGVK